MPTTKKKPVKKTAATSKNGPPLNGAMPVAGSDVMTPAEAAAFLRVAEADVLRGAEAHEIPARRIGGAWRFLESALREWLGATPSQPKRNDFWSTQLGAFKDDPNLDEMLRE